MKIVVIGTGYVGLVTGACFSELGHFVTCVDNQAEKISLLEKGNIPIFEPGLERIVAKNIKQKRLVFSSSKDSVKGSEAVFIAVGTPTGSKDGEADLSYVFQAAKDIANYLTDGMVVVNKSTVPVGTAGKVRDIIKEIRPELKFHVVSNPEFLREGCAVKDFLEPDRIIIGVDSADAEAPMEKLYEPLTRRDIPIIFTDTKTSELTKYAANGFLATKIAFMDEMADLCEALGANVEHVGRGMGMDHRIGKEYLKPGPGFGGSCFPKDTLALRKMSIDAEMPSRIVEAVIFANEKRKIRMAHKVIKAAGGSVKGKTIGVLGVAFKANTDDIRHSASLMIIPELQREGAKIRLYDPKAMEQAKQTLSGNIHWCENAYEVAEGADALVIITEWDEFKKLSLSKIKAALKNPVIVDLRNLYSRKAMRTAGFTYVSVGRKPVNN